MEFTTWELFWLHRLMGQAGAGDNLADAMFRSDVRGKLGFTDEEEKQIGYAEIDHGNGQWTFDFDRTATLERELSSREQAKILGVMNEAIKTMSPDQFGFIKEAILRLGWKPADE